MLQVTLIQENPVLHSLHLFSPASQEGSPMQELAANTNMDRGHKHWARWHKKNSFKNWPKNSAVWANLGKPANVKHECILRGLQVIRVAWVLWLLPAAILLRYYHCRAVLRDAFRDLRVILSCLILRVIPILPLCSAKSLLKKTYFKIIPHIKVKAIQYCQYMTD